VSDKPNRARAAGGMDACVIRDGWQMSDRTPPRLSPRAKNRRDETKRSTSSGVPSSSNDTIPP
jgi:hypothetical protein